MAHFYQQHVLPQEALTSQYSVLHQERMYLLQALAAEESQGEQLTQSLSALQTQIETSEAAQPPGNTRRLKQQCKHIRTRLGACQMRERALAVNIARIVAQLEGMKRYQWRNAQQDYAVQLQLAQQHAQMVLMSPSRPAFALRSPANVDLSSQMQYMSIAPSAGGPLFGNRATLKPYLGGLNQSFSTINASNVCPETSSAQMYAVSPYLAGDVSSWSGLSDVPDSSLNISTPTSATSLPGMSPTWQDWHTAKPDAVGRPRASSLLGTVHEHPSRQTWANIASNNALRRLSLLDGSAALKLERQATEERDRFSSDAA